MPKIMLDAGHTGKYWNKGAVPGYYESAVMWELQEELAAALQERGFAVGRARGTIDTELEVTRRGRRAKGYDLFLSLHSNAADDRSVRRAVGIYQTDDTQGTWDDRSRAVAYLMAKTVAEVMGVPYKITSKTAGGDRDGDGKKDDNYYGVLHGARMEGVPGVIVEHSFHTSPQTCNWLLNKENLRLLAGAEADALAVYFGLQDPEPEEEEPEEETVAPPDPDPFTPWRGKVTPTNGLNIRTGPGTGYKKLGAMKMGTEIKILEESAGWGRIASPKAGWVSLDYVKRM